MATMQTKVRQEPIVELRERVESMMIAAMTNNFVCAICIENISGYERRGVLATPCGHVFHDDCLKQWFPAHFGPDNGRLTPRTMKRRLETGPCPTCKGELELHLCTKIFLQAEGGMTPLNTSMTTRFSDVEKMLDDTKKQLDDAKMEASKTRQELASALNELFRSEQQVEVLKMKAEEAKMEAEEAKKEAQEAKKEAQEAKKEAQEAKMEAEAVKKNLERINQALAEGEEEKQKRMDAQISERVIKKQAADMKKELKELKKELKELKKEHSKCSKYEKQVDTCLGRIRKAIESVPRRLQDSDADSDDQRTENP